MSRTRPVTAKAAFAAADVLADFFDMTAEAVLFAVAGIKRRHAIRRRARDRNNGWGGQRHGAGRKLNKQRGHR